MVSNVWPTRVHQQHPNVISDFDRGNMNTHIQSISTMCDIFRLSSLDITGRSASSDHLLSHQLIHVKPAAAHSVAALGTGRWLFTFQRSLANLSVYSATIASWTDIKRAR